VTTYIALLRAVNVGGTRKLPMARLKAWCTQAGFGRVETYIASGNVVFDSERSPAQVRAQLEAPLRSYAGRDVGVFVRTAVQMQAVWAGNPFADREARFTYVFFLDHKPPPNTISDCRGRGQELLRLARREIYVYYPTGMGRSRLQIPAARAGTARNMNTVAKLVAMSAGD
jgi:uncharacterized protein (DUF1697 family)